MTVTFEVPGRPHAKQRARSAGRVVYTPKATVNAETFIRLTAAPHFVEPLIGPIRLMVVAYFVPPPSWSKRKREAALGGLHTQRPDFDNIQKSVCDALNGVAYVDDSQIAEATCRKEWGARERTVITVYGADLAKAQERREK